MIYKSPEGAIYPLFEDMLKQTHLLIAGASGSGKSVLVNGIISTALYRFPDEIQFILIDPKRVELAQYKNLPHTIGYYSEPDNMILGLQNALKLIENRYMTMQKQSVKKYQGGHVYIIIDELADLMTTNRKTVQPILQRISQIGRASNVHLIACTQCPLSSVIPTPIKVNFDSRVGLRTRNKQDSRNILDHSGLETLPRYGQGVYLKPEGETLIKIPCIKDEELDRLVKWWECQKPYTIPQRKQFNIFQWLKGAR